MARLFITIWPFTTIQICSKAKTNFAKVGSKFDQILDKLSDSMPKSFLIWPKWQNCAKSVHTVQKGCTTKAETVF